MFQKVKDALNNSVLWLMFLLGCVLWLWKKEGDAEQELAETKAEGTLKNEEEKTKQLDSAGDDATDHYEQLRRQYLDEHPND